MKRSAGRRNGRLTVAKIRTLASYLRERHGERIHKIAIDGGFTCPNRDGSKGTAGCAFCDAEGSRAPYCDAALPIGEQARRGVESLSGRFGARLFIVYFQSFSGSYAPPDVLEERYEAALIDRRIVGLSVATRSDCLSPEGLDVLASYVGRLEEVWLELGLQTTNTQTLGAMGCGHGPDDFARTARAARERGLRVVAHVIHGLPGDRPEDVLACADLVNDLGVEGVKLHNLYLTRDSALGRRYLQTPFRLPSRDEHLAFAAQFVARLDPAVVIDRLVGDAPRDRLVAPEWRIDRRRQWDLVSEEMDRRGLAQGSQRQGDGARTPAS